MDALRCAAMKAVAGHAEAVLEPLLTYDLVHGGDLVHTLTTYLECGCNASKAAEQLFLHRSGMLYRLRRIEALCGVRLDVFEDRVVLELAVLTRAVDRSDL